IVRLAAARAVAGPDATASASPAGAAGRAAVGITTRDPAAIWGSAPSGGAGVFRAWGGGTRAATPGARISYMGEFGLVEAPRPSAWPSSCSTVVSKSYWPEPI